MEKKIVFVTGGQRSGKSRFALELAESISSNPVYLATARRWDADFEKRIFKHQSDRSEIWHTVEEEKKLSSLNLEGRTVLLDCITLWLTNVFNDNGYDLDKSLAWSKEEWNKFIKKDFSLIVVSNEIGMGLHAQDEASRHFTDLQGWVNQHIAFTADTVYFMVSGIPLKIK
jgi:adenosylcobinamide kinase / adenosylcobinamide-phosphate guanylyltransferase